MDFLFEKYDIVIGVDLGNHGGISIISTDTKDVEVFPMPIVKKDVGTKKKPKKKTEIDENSIVAILEKYKDKKVAMAQELVHSMPGEGSSSSFIFGVSSGFFKGVAKAFHFDLHIVSPVSWKKTYLELESAEISLLREKSKVIKTEIKALSKKDKLKIKEKKKELDKINRNIKSEAKSKARELASKLVPSLKGEFEQVNSDGKAESVLIGLYLLGKINELVQNIKL
jgi:hypothetical protein